MAKASVQNLVRELQRQGFHIDPRARHAYKLASVHAGAPERYRVDIGQRSARLEVKHGDTWSGASDTHYFGSLTPEYAARWAEWARLAIEDKHRPDEPQAHRSEKDVAAQKRADEKRALEKRREHARTSGPGFYVTNGSTGPSRVADHPAPFRSLEEAIDHAKERYAHLLGLRLTYLLPVEVIEAASRDEAESGQGYVGWTNGKRRGPPVPKEQLRLEGVRTVREILPLLVAERGHPRRWWVEERTGPRRHGYPGYLLFRNARGEWAVASTKDVDPNGIVMATFFGPDESGAHDHFAFLAAPTA